jgi:hypothetical protein
MRREIAFTAVAVPLLLFGTAISMQAQEPALAHKGRVVTPESGIERPEYRGSHAYDLQNFCARKPG